MSEPGANPFLLLLRRRWWLVVIGLVPTVLVTTIGASGQPPVYESTSTFVVRPVQRDAERVMRAMDTLLRGVEINTTFADIVSSRRVESRAKERLDLPEHLRGGLSASGRAITGTSILEIHASAADPQVAQDFAAAVGDETVTYITELDNGFEVVALDPPSLPGGAVSPGAVFSTALPVLLGTVLGLGLVYASGQLKPLNGRRRFDIVDPVTGAATEAYFLQRLREEVARVDRSGGALTVALLVPIPSVGPRLLGSQIVKAELARPNDATAPPRRLQHILGPQVRGTARRVWAPVVGLLTSLLGASELSRTAERLRRELHPSEVLAYVGAGRFAILAPDRIAPALGPQLRARQPTLGLRVAETTYLGSANGGGGHLDDLPTVLPRLEERLHHANHTTTRPLSVHTAKPYTTPWPVRP